MALVDQSYAQRYSHTTVSRWETGHTRPSAKRIRVFGSALGLSDTEISGLLLLGGFGPEFDLSSVKVHSRDAKFSSGEQYIKDHGKTQHSPVDSSPSFGKESSFAGLGRFLGFRIFPIGIWIIALGYAMSFLDWSSALSPSVYVGLVVAAVLAQGFISPDKAVPLRELYWISIFFFLSTPFLQFAPLVMDHYNFYTVGDFSSMPVPYVLALLLNLALAAAAGMMFDVLWRIQYRSDKGSKEAFRRAAWVAILPVVFVFSVVVVITNSSVTLQLALVFPTLGIIFTCLELLRDPALNPGEREQRVLFPTALLGTTVTFATGLFVILFVYAAPELPRILPDHNLVASWELDFDDLGYTREEALQKVNLGYLWHALCVLAYIVFLLEFRLLVDVYRMGGAQGGMQSAGHSLGVHDDDEEVSGAPLRRPPLPAHHSDALQERGPSADG